LKDGIELETWLACCFDLEPDEAARPSLNLLEVKTGENNQKKKHLLVGHPFFRMGKLPDNEVVAINPSVSRRHAVIAVLKGGTVAFIDLRSKSLSYINGLPVKDDHVPVHLRTGDVVSLGTSSRMYHVKIDTSRVVEYYEKRQRDLRREIQRLDSSDPLASFGLTDNPRVLIGNLPFHTTVDEIQDFFAACGSIKDVAFPQNSSRPNTDAGLRATRGMAFVTFSDTSGARAALPYDQRSFGGRRLRVSYAT